MLKGNPQRDSIFSLALPKKQTLFSETWANYRMSGLLGSSFEIFAAVNFPFRFPKKVKKSKQTDNYGRSEKLLDICFFDECKKKWKIVLMKKMHSITEISILLSPTQGYRSCRNAFLKLLQKKTFPKMPTCGENTGKHVWNSCLISLDPIALKDEMSIRNRTSIVFLSLQFSFSSELPEIQFSSALLAVWYATERKTPEVDSVDNCLGTGRKSRMSNEARIKIANVRKT